MIAMLKLSPLAVQTAKWTGNNMEDFYDMFGYESVAGDGDSVRIASTITVDCVEVPLGYYVINLFGAPVVLDEDRFLSAVTDYYNTDEGEFMVYTKDSILEEKIKTEN